MNKNSVFVFLTIGCIVKRQQIENMIKYNINKRMYPQIPPVCSYHNRPEGSKPVFFNKERHKVPIQKTFDPFTKSKIM